MSAAPRSVAINTDPIARLSIERDRTVEALLHELPSLDRDQRIILAREIDEFADRVRWIRDDPW